MKNAILLMVTGGARSGKTGFAQNEALSRSQNPLYVATAPRYDDPEFQNRIKRHVAERDSRWETIEEKLSISKHGLSKKVVVIDCVTLWLSNFFSLYKYDVQHSLDAIKLEIDALMKVDACFIMITNELGMGLHAETETGRKFTDLQGWTNQFISARADKVVFMVSGIPLTIKNEQ